MHIEIHNHLTIPSTVKLIVFEIQKHLKQFKQFCFKFYCFVSPPFPHLRNPGVFSPLCGEQKGPKTLGLRICHLSLSLSFSDLFQSPHCHFSPHSIFEVKSSHHSPTWYANLSYCICDKFCTICGLLQFLLSIPWDRSCTAVNFNQMALEK